MKKGFILLLFMCIVGCSNGGADFANYLENPRELIRDPHYSQYKADRDALESQYLHKEITYAEYMEQVRIIDDNYTKEVDERTHIIDSTY